jgi:hypothetical protein
MKSKYQFRERGKDYSFENKNVFINHCQHKYQKSLYYSNPSEYYSYDFGETWNLISNFKSERQTIQNEKKPQNEIRNHSTKSESKSGWGTYLIYVLSIWGGLSLINNKVTPIGFVNKINTELFGSNSNLTNKNNQEVLPNTQNNDETITEDNSSDGINDEPIQNEVNSQTESNESYIDDNSESSDYNSQTESNDNSSSNTYQEPKYEKQQITCPNCQGKGFETCRQCSGNGMMKCSRCNNKGTIWTNGREESCYECNGTMRKNCDRCHGKGNTGSCRPCRGQGYYFK